jgi:hypothetical protein
VDAATRPLTDPERLYFQWHTIRARGGSLKEILLGGCFGAGCLSTPILLGLLIWGLRLASPPWRWWAIGGLGSFALIWIIIVMSGMVQRRARAARSTDTRKAMEADLAGGVARIDRYKATGLMLAYFAQRSERTYFVRLEDQRVLFLAPWTPPGCDVKGMEFRPDERGFPSREFEIATGPLSMLLLEVRGTGELLRPEVEFDMAQGLRRIRSGDFVKIAWEDIRKTYG